jgi:hypothetical protein
MRIRFLFGSGSYFFFQTFADPELSIRWTDGSDELSEDLDKADLINDRFSDIYLLSDLLLPNGQPDWRSPSCEACIG